jgi:hypothetical protein
MDYDFSGLCADQLEKLEKRLTSIQKANIKEYCIALNVLNSPQEHEARSQTKQEINDIFNDVNTKLAIIYTEALNKVQRVLRKNL